jgi:glycosyltransferase involved in cell wall biosynthesis
MGNLPTGDSSAVATTAVHAIESVLAQQGVATEIIASDDGSVDATLDIVDAGMAGLHHARLLRTPKTAAYLPRAMSAPGCLRHCPRVSRNAWFPTSRQALHAMQRLEK